MSRIVSELIYQIKADATAFVSDIEKSQAKFKKFGDDIGRVGKKLTLGVTTPLVAAGTAFVKLASDAEETNGKFDAVFKDQADTVRSWAENFSEQVGRSRTANIDFLATIQDTLVPLGFQRTAATEMSKAAVELATDLASFNNLNTADVIKDIQSALVGNTEVLRKYGVVASQEVIVQEALNSQLIQTASELDATSKAQAIYNLIVQGTTDAQGDALRTADSAANRFQALKASVEDLSIAFGNELLPIVSDAVAKITETVKGFTALDQETKQTILRVAAVAAAIGPLLVVLGKLVAILPLIKAGMLALSSPVGLAVAAIGLFAINAAKAIKETREFRQEFEKLEQALSGQAGIEDTRKQLERQREEIANNTLEIQRHLEELEALEGQRSRNAQASAQAARSAINRLETANQLAERRAAQLEESISRLEEEELAERARAAAINATAEAQRRLQEEVRREAEAREAAAAAAAEAARLRVTEQYQIARQEIVAILASELSEYEKIQQQIDQLNATPWRPGELENDRIAALEVLRARQQQAVEAERQESQRRLQEKLDEEARIFFAVQARIEAQDKAAEEEHKKEMARIAERNAAIVSAAKQAWGQVGDIVSQSYTNQLNIANSAYDKQRDILEKQIDDEDEKKAAIEELEKRRAIEVAQIKRKEEAFNRVQTLVNIASNTAGAIMKALEQLGPIAGGIATGFISGLGAAQAAAVLAKPLPAIPSFATGVRNFMVPDGFPNDSFPIRVQSGERVTVETPQQQAQGEGGGVHLHVGTLVADRAGLRELDRQMRKYTFNGGR